jgi:hypothetical protein
MIRIPLLLAICILSACARDSSRDDQPAQTGIPASVPEDARWLLERMTDDERFVRVATHLRGFDVAMVETGYRYGELYWASRDRNWDYAAYQLRKIETAVANGVERRPLRAPSARMLDGAVAGARHAVTRRDAAALDAAFANLTAVCNACHQAEQVPFIRVQPPMVRASVVHEPAGQAR